MSIGVAVIGLGVTDQAVGPRPADQIVDRPGDRVGIAALGRGRAFQQQSRAGKRRHRGWVATLIGRPVAPPRLGGNQPVEATSDRLVDLESCGFCDRHRHAGGTSNNQQRSQ